MSYLVLARKWRPQGFDDLIGQEPIVRILTNSITQGKMAHAYVFSGPRGVGKTSTARIMAKALNCQKGPTPSPCGLCDSCVSITEGHSVDVIEIDGASNNSVDDIRDLRDRVKYAPSSGRYKVYIIDEAHMLSAQAFNALLKTLEEPPPHVFFVLATTAPRKIPLTVLSRCQHLPFRRVSLQNIKERLRRISEAEGINAPDGVLALIARAADGSIRDSLTILDQVASFSAEVTEGDVKDLLGMADFRALSDISKAVLDGDRKEVLAMVAGLVDRGTDLRAFAKDMVKFFRDLLVARMVSAPDEVLDISGDELEALKETAAMVSDEELALALSEMIKAEQDVRTAFSPRVALEMALIKISYLSMLKPVSEAISALSGQPDIPEAKAGAQAPRTHAEGARAAAREPEPKRKAPPQGPRTREKKGKTADAKAPLDSEPTDGAGALLKAIVGKIEDVRVASKLSAASPSLDGDTLSLTFNSSEAEICADSVRQNTALVEEIAAGIRGAPVKIAINIKHSRTPSKKELKEKAMAEPLIQEALELFEGRVVDVRQVEGENLGNGG